MPSRKDSARRVLGELSDELRRASAALAAAAERADRLAAARDAGGSYRDIVPAEPPPLIVESISDVLTTLTGAGARWRREEARALHNEGLSMEQIAKLFGVTRQRVSALINAK